MNKLKSRKLWIAIAAILASVGTTIAGLGYDSQYIAIAGIICAAASGAIYNICESLVDSSYAQENGDILIYGEEEEE